MLTREDADYSIKGGLESLKDIAGEDPDGNFERCMNMVTTWVVSSSKKKDRSLPLIQFAITEVINADK